MSRPQKLHKPIKLDFNQVLGAVAMGKGQSKRAALKLSKEKTGMAKKPLPPPKT